MRYTILIISIIVISVILLIGTTVWLNTVSYNFGPSDTTGKLKNQVKSELYNSTIKKVTKDTVVQMYQLARDFHDVAEKNGLFYWIIGGTLIGAIRHQGIIPWDDDIDIGIRDKDIDILLKLKPQFEALDYEIVEFPLFGYKIFPKNGQEHEGDSFKFPWIDIFVYKESSKSDDDVGGNEDNNFFILAYPEARKLWIKDFFTIESINKRQLYSIGNMNLWGPSKAIPFLNRVYKDWNIKGYYAGLHDSPCEPQIWELSDEDFEPAKPASLSLSRI